MAKKVDLLISQAVLDKGINVVMASFTGANIVNKNAALERLKKEKIQKIVTSNLSDNQILKEYVRLQQEAGIADPKPPAQWLIEIIQANQRLPNINTVVDSYNIVSAETGLAIGAHDLNSITGSIRFAITNGNEKYTPLGATFEEKVNQGEYACMDDEKILCRLDKKQCAETKITKDTKEFMVYVQGNRFVSCKALQTALDEVGKNITAFCGGNYEINTSTIIP
jgi:DNA/RNA-binding domain of Phe-tRNA-synthetase-like protein